MAGELINLGQGGQLAAYTAVAVMVGRYIRATFPKAVARVDKIFDQKLAAYDQEAVATTQAAQEGKLAVALLEAAQQRGLDFPTKEPPINVLYPLLNAAMLEEDDDLIAHWAQMFVNAHDANAAAETRRAYVSLFQDCTRLDVRNLAALHEARQDNPGCTQFYTALLPEKVPAGYPQMNKCRNDGEVTNGLPSPEVLRSLWNLKRLGLIDNAVLDEGDPSLRIVNITALGIGLVEACTLPRPK